MKVKVVKCSSHNYWYHKHIGKTFEVIHGGGLFGFTYRTEVDGRHYYLMGNDVEIINETKESNMQERKPHVHAEVIKAWSDGAEIQVKSFEASKWVDCQHPYWDRDFYRVKPDPEFPKTTLTDDNLFTLYDDEASGREGFKSIANGAIKHFITSGQMDEYIKERDND